METETAFVSAESGVELDAVTKVCANLTLVVYPSHTECEDTIGLYNTLNDLGSLEFGVLVVFFFNRFQDFANGLQILILTRMFGLQVGHDFIYFHIIEI